MNRYSNRPIRFIRRYRPGIMPDLMIDAYAAGTGDLSINDAEIDLIVVIAASHFGHGTRRARRWDRAIRRSAAIFNETM